MSVANKTVATAIVGLLLGSILTAGVMYQFQSSSTPADSNDSNDDQPLYWVAPMDDNYRRDKPGKSPMGMDLVPVYKTDTDASNAGEGVVTIDPHIVNNLGVRTAPVELKAIDTKISTVGYVQFDEDNLVHIHPRVEGWIEKLYVKAAGDPVQQGQALYTLYSPQLVNAQEEFLIALKRDNKTLISAAFERLTALQLPKEFIEQLRQDRTAKQTVTFYAPQSGVLDGLQIREGFYVKPGNTLMSIGKLERVWVEAEVFERDVTLVEAGTPVSMTLDYVPGETWNGKVDYVYPTLNPMTRTLRIRAVFQNDNLLLKPNMFAQVVIHTKTEQEAIVVPKESVIRTGQQDRVVLALGDGKFKSVEVSIGQVTDTNIEIIEGLSDSDVVVTSAQFLIDSESNKNSDFKRMSDPQKPTSIWIEGTINEVMTAHRMVNISHEPAEEWDWPKMTMDFVVDPSVDIEQMAASQSLHFEVTKEQNNYTITGIHIMQQEEQVASATVVGEINSIGLQQRVLNISREAIEKWDRGPATMDFYVADHIPMESLQTGMQITFTFEVRNDLVIVNIEGVSETQDAKTSNMEMNHQNESSNNDVDHSNH